MRVLNIHHFILYLVTNCPCLWILPCLTCNLKMYLLLNNWCKKELQYMKMFASICSLHMKL